MRFPSSTPSFADVIDRFWPVGAIYFSAVDTNPADLLGVGTWVAFGAGRVPVGLDAGQAEFDTLLETGGAKDVTLTAAQSGLPQHTHVQNAHSHVQTVNSATTGGLSGYTPDTSTNSGGAAGYSTQPATAVNQDAGPTNASQAHTNLQPYIVVRMWRRTA
jgi:microcystin-dependent protein